MRLNRAIAVAMVHGPVEGAAAAERLAPEPAMRGYALLPATLGELYRRSGDRVRAAEQLRTALTKSCTEVERRFLQRRLEEVEGS